MYFPFMVYLFFFIFSRFAVEIFFTTAYKKFLLQIFWQHFIEIQKIICWKKQCFSSLFCFHPKVFNHRGISIHFPQNIKQTFYIVIFLMFSTYINQSIFLEPYFKCTYFLKKPLNIYCLKLNFWPMTLHSCQ